MEIVPDKQVENKEAVQRDEQGRFIKGRGRWKPGESGNPKGRPKTITLSEAYRNALAQPMPNDKQGRTIAEVIAEKLALEAAKGSIKAAKEIADRVEGRPKQAVDLTANLFDWREMAKTHGINERDVLIEAGRLITAALESGSDELDSTAT